MPVNNLALILIVLSSGGALFVCFIRAVSEPEETARVCFNLSSFYLKCLQPVSTACSWNSKGELCLWKNLFPFELVPVLKTSFMF